MNARTGLSARAVLSVAAGAALLGFAPIGLRLSDVGPQATAFWRFAFALPILVALAAWERRGGASTAIPGDAKRMLLVAGVCFGMDIALWHWALTLTTVANATLFSNMTPILAAAGGWFLLKERPTLGFFLGAAVGLAGAAALSLSAAQARPGALTGDLIALGSALWYAGYLMIMRVARRSVSALDAMAWTTAAALGLAAVATWAAGETFLPHSAQGWAILAGLGLVVHVGGQGLIAAGLGGLPLSVSTVALWVQPVAAAALSWVLFNERLGPFALTGAALVLAGVWIVQRSRA